MTSPATNLRISLQNAARTAQEHGATQAQIDMIVALARGSNDYSAAPGHLLSKKGASHIIDTMIADGAVADFNKSDDELNDEDEAAAEIANTIAYKAASKKQKSAAKAFREKTANEAAMSAAVLRRVHHVKFGAGSVITEGDVLVIAFDSQKKPMRVGASFVTAL